MSKDLFASYVAAIPSRLTQATEGVWPEGVASDGTRVSAEYDDGTTLPNHYPISALHPMLVTFERGGLTFDLFDSGNFSVTLPGGRSVLIENGRPWTY
jgi:hypothetical protein